MTKELKDGRVETVTIDLSTVRTAAELHDRLNRSLGFGDVYGHNWDAFWDFIIGGVEMPKTLVLLGWDQVQHALPGDAAIMMDLCGKLNDKFPAWACAVKYR